MLERSARRRLYEDYEHLVLGSFAVILFLVFWEGLSRGYWAALLQPMPVDSGTADGTPAAMPYPAFSHPYASPSAVEGVEERARRPRSQEAQRRQKWSP